MNSSPADASWGRMRALILSLLVLLSLAGCEEAAKREAPVSTAAPVAIDAGAAGAIPEPAEVDNAPAVVVDAAPAPDAAPAKPANKPRPPPPAPKPDRECGPVCKIYCPHGNVLDGDGCPTCRCNKDPGLIAPKTCPRMPACGLGCPGPFAKDTNGCTMCACAEDGVRPPRP